LIVKAKKIFLLQAIVLKKISIYCL